MSHRFLKPFRPARATARNLLGSVSLEPVLARACFEPLEERRMMAIVGTFGGGAPLVGSVPASLGTPGTTGSIWFDSGVVYVAGTGTPDTVTISRNARDSSVLNVKLNDVVVRYNLADVDKIDVSTFQGADRVSILETKGDITIPFDVSAGRGYDTVYGGSGNDTVVGGRGNDLLVGNDGNDELFGGEMNDRIVGGSGDDSLFGEQGNDNIDTGEGTDQAEGGEGRNSIDVANAFTTAQRSKNIDRIDPLIFQGEVDGYTPAQVRRAYNFGSLTDPSYTNLGEGQTIVVVNAFYSTTVASDLAVFSQTFGLPNDPSDFEVVFANGRQPGIDEGWAAETALDVQWIKAIAPRARIVLVAAETNLNVDMFQAVKRAAEIANAAGGGVVSQSFGRQEGNAFYDQKFDEIYRFYKNVSFVASAGNVFQELNYPAVSQYVTAVGGTFLPLDSAGNRFSTEVGWDAGGGGISGTQQAPGYQADTLLAGVTPIGSGIGFRVVPDISYNADPVSGVAVFNTTELDGFTGWAPFGGTSAGAPQISAMVALANELRFRQGKANIGQTLNDKLYTLGRTNRQEVYRDITNISGDSSNSFASDMPGFDQYTGWGTPIAYGPTINGVRTGLVNRLADVDTNYLSSSFEWKANLYSSAADVPTGGVLVQGLSGSGYVSGSRRLLLDFNISVINPNSGTTNTGSIVADNLYVSGDGSVYGVGSMSFTSSVVFGGPIRFSGTFVGGKLSLSFYATDDNGEEISTNPFRLASGQIALKGTLTTD